MHQQHAEERKRQQRIVDDMSRFLSNTGNKPVSSKPIYQSTQRQQRIADDMSRFLSNAGEPIYS